MNGAPLSYNSATSHQEYEGTPTINPGDLVTVVVTTGGKTYTASGNQITSYPAISTPTSGATWSGSSSNTVTWSGGAPLANSSYILSVLDASDPAGGQSYTQQIATGTTNFSIPAYYGVSGGNRDVIVGLVSTVAIPNAYTNSKLWLGGFDSAPVTVTGMHLTSRTSSSPTSLQSVAWSGTQFVAVGWSGAILTSPDKVTWTSRTPNTGQPLNAMSDLYNVVWSGTQFVAVGNSGIIITSPDGITWTPRNSGTQGVLYGIAWSGTQFVAVGWSGTVLTSPDGITWTSHAPPTSNVLQAVTWSGTQFVTVGRGGVVFTSPDGTTWTQQTSGIGTFSFLNGITWSGTQFVVVGYADGSCCSDIIFTSPDGVTWTPRTSGVNVMPNAVAWSGSEFVAVGGLSITGAILTSPDGISWTQQASGTKNHLAGVTWSGSDFVIVGDANTVLTSP